MNDVTPSISSPGITVFPNPCHDVAWEDCMFSDDCTGRMVEVVDMLGRIVISARAKAPTTSMRMNMAGLPAGAYAVRTSNRSLIPRMLIKTD